MTAAAGYRVYAEWVPAGMQRANQGFAVNSLQQALSGHCSDVLWHEVWVLMGFKHCADVVHTLCSCLQANFAKRDKHAQLRSNFSASLDDFAFNRFSGSFSDHRAASLDPTSALLSPRSTATLVGQSFTTDDINFGSSTEVNPGLTLKVGSGSNGGGSPHNTTGEGVLSPKSGGGRAAERGLAASSVPLTGAYGGEGNTPTSAFSGAAGVPPEQQQLSMVRDKYMVFCLDSSDTIDRLGKLLARKGKVLMGLAKAGHSVGLAVASAFNLQDTSEMLKAKGISTADLDFAVTSCGAEVWYCGEAAAAGSSGGKKASEGCVLDDAYDLKLDQNWDALSVRRVLNQCMGQLLRQLPGVASASAAKANASSGFSRRASLSLALPRYKIQVEPAGSAHHLLVALDPQHGSDAPAGDDSAAAADNSKSAQPALSAQDVETLITRIKRRLRKSGLRTQVGGGADSRLNTPQLRAECPQLLAQACAGPSLRVETRGHL